MTAGQLPVADEVIRDLTERTWLGRHRLAVADRLKMRTRPGSADYLTRPVPLAVQFEDALVDAAVRAAELARQTKPGPHRASLHATYAELLGMACAAHDHPHTPATEGVRRG